ncbi:lycopene cyclase family protein [Streptomyces sp. NPDC001914]|uniref:lycopene cyclase family protein n=1 Tax=Streptomyces sp. NPDC001914 TaxID=3364623 RepID=UPI00369DB304
MLEADVAIVGAGAAGLSLAHRLAYPATGTHRPSVLLISAPPGPLRPPRRTWCFWERGRGRFDAAVTAAWQHLRVHTPIGQKIEDNIAPLRYKMIASDNFEAFIDHYLAQSSTICRIEASVEAIEGISNGVHLHTRTAEGYPETLRARWVFDSRPLGSLPAARTTLLQHFHGWFVHTEQPISQPDVVDLMDFRTPQPPRGLSFGYILPTGRHHALVEYTEFSAQTLSRHEYEAALHHYTKDILGFSNLQIVSTETGVIPMTDGVFARQTAPSVFRIGAAGGATRPSTGYTFAAIQRQTAAVADALARGRTPLPPPAHSARSRAMDAVMLRALASGRVDGAAFFAHLFTQVPMERLLRFLDGRTRLTEDLGVGFRTPVLPMLRSAAELTHLPRRSFPGP